MMANKPKAKVYRRQYTVSDERNVYKFDIHYKMFVIVYPANNGIEQNAKEVYLTLKGLLKVRACKYFSLFKYICHVILSFSED